MSRISHIIRAASSEGKSWGRWAARRYIMNKCCYNEATALRVLTLVLQLEAVK